MFLYFSRVKLGRAGLAPEENAAAEGAEEDVVGVLDEDAISGEITTLLKVITKLW